MFTGIVRHVGRIESTRSAAGGARLAIDLGPLAAGLKLGDSVAVSGACLTVTALDGSRASFDVVAETLRRTTLGSLTSGARVNLERSLSLGQTLDGHLVQGHVDGVATVRSAGRPERDGGRLWEFAAEAGLVGQMVAKGSVAIDGVSLTLVDVADERFSVALIPTTLAETTLADLAVGATVNVETDLIGKYVLRYLRQMTGSAAAPDGLSLDKLRQAGFL